MLHGKVTMADVGVQPKLVQEPQAVAGRPYLFYGWWLVVVTLITQGVGAGIINFSYSVMVVPLEQEFHATRFEMMLAITCCLVFSSLLGPWLGPKADRRSMRTLMAAGVTFLALGFGVMSFATAVWQVILCYAAFMSFAQLLLGPLTASTLIGRWFTTRRGTALGIAAMGTPLGGFLFPPLIQHFITAFDWRMASRLAAVIALVVTLPPVWLLVVNRPADKGLDPEGGDTPEPASAHAASGGQLTTRSVLHRQEFWAIIIPVGMSLAVLTAVMNNMVPYALGEGLTLPQATGLIAIVAVATMVGNLLFGVIADRMDLRLALAVSMVFVCVALVVFRSGHSVWPLRVATLVFGVSAGGIVPLWSAMVGRVFGVENFGRVRGLMSPVIMPMTMVASPLAGFIFDQTRSYQMVFNIFFVALALSAVLLARLPRMGH